MTPAPFPPILPPMETLTIELPAELASAVRKAAADEAFASPAAFVVDLVAEWLADTPPHPDHLAYMRAAVAEAQANAGPDYSLEELDAQLRRTIDNARRRAA